MARASVILITGTPGVGKTVLARGLARRLGFRFVEVGRLVEEERLYSAYDKVRRSYVIDEKRLSSVLRKNVGERVVLPTHFLSGGFVYGAEAIAVVLRLSPVVLWRRLRARGWSRQKAWENVESEFLDLCLFDAVRALAGGRVFEIDTTGKSRARMLTEVLRLVQGRGKRNARRVDWLKTYDPVELGRRLRIG